MSHLHSIRGGPTLPTHIQSFISICCRPPRGKKTRHPRFILWANFFPLSHKAILSTGAEEQIAKVLLLLGTFFVLLSMFTHMVGVCSGRKVWVPMVVIQVLACKFYSTLNLAHVNCGLYPLPCWQFCRSLSKFLFYIVSSVWNFLSIWCIFLEIKDVKKKTLGVWRPTSVIRKTKFFPRINEISF